MKTMTIKPPALKLPKPKPVLQMYTLKRDVDVGTVVGIFRLALDQRVSSYYVMCLNRSMETDSFETFNRWTDSSFKTHGEVQDYLEERGFVPLAKGTKIVIEQE